MRKLIAQALRALLLIALLALVAPAARAQDMPILANSSPSAVDPNVKVPVYDVASVKVNKSGPSMMRIMNPPDGFSCSNLSLKAIIANAYAIRQELISGGPGWVESTRFDVDAKVAGSGVQALQKVSQRQRASMLQPLLADRFKLKVHHEIKILPVYDLILAKGGPKLKESAPDGGPGEAEKDSAAASSRARVTFGPGIFQGQAISMQSVANQLSYVVHSTVVDRTGLRGTYDLDLKWRPEDAAPSGGDAADESLPSIFTAVQEQLGLKLQPTRGPVDTLVIDHAELPSED